VLAWESYVEAKALRLARAVLQSEDPDALFDDDYFPKPLVELTSDGPLLSPIQPDVNNVEG